MRTISLGEPVQPTVAVNLFGRTFHPRPMTRSVVKQVEEANAAVQAATSSDEAVERMANLLDVALIPTGNQRKSAGTLVREKWEAEELDLQMLSAFHERIVNGEAVDRPT